jgi:predicted MFS family arabinose efflux permease
VAVDSRRAWVLVLLAFTAMFVCVGTGFSYGTLVLPLTRDLGIGQGAASGVYAVTIMVFFMAGAPIGMVSDRVGPRPVLLLGAVSVGGGLALTAAAGDVALVYVGHGLLVGLAMACSFVPLTVVVSAAFLRRRSVAVGVAVSGIGVGTLVMAPLTAYLINLLGWRSTYLVIAVGACATLLVCAGAVGTHRPVRDAGPAAAAHLGDGLRGSLASGDYRLLYGAQVLLSVAVFTPFVHLPAYAEDSGVARVTAAGLVGVIGAASVLGRLALGPVADRIGMLVTFRMCYLAIASSFLLWLWPAGSYPALLVHAALFGVGYGGFVALLPGVLAERFGLASLGSLLGLMYTANVLGAGLGPLLSGLLIEEHGYAVPATTALVGGMAGFWLLRGVGRRTGR